MGTIVPFPSRPGAATAAVPAAGRFTPEMLLSLLQFAESTFGAQPVWFGADEHGLEFCRFGNGLRVSWNREGGLVLTDTVSGYVNNGPFSDLGELYRLMTDLGA